MKPSEEWIEEVMETVAAAMFATFGPQPPQIAVPSLLELIERIQKDAKASNKAIRLSRKPK